MIRAEQLINGLGGEKERWTELTETLHETYYNIIGDVLLSSGVVAYLAPFTPIYRQVNCLILFISMSNPMFQSPVFIKPPVFRYASELVVLQPIRPNYYKMLFQIHENKNLMWTLNNTEVFL